MFTECPKCGIAFRVTAKVLQQAKGNVRCGGCSNAFNAVEYLSEEMPEFSGSAAGDVPLDELAETSKRLLKTLDELAGSEDVRIEDTGVEWRVLGDADEEAVAADEQAEAEIVEEEDLAERRYDDNSPLPEGVRDENELEPDLLAIEQVAAEVDHHLEFSDAPEFNAADSDLTLSDPEEWTDLLEEVRDPEANAGAAEEPDASSSNEPPDSDEFTGDNTDIADMESQFKSQAEALGLDLTGSEPVLSHGTDEQVERQPERLLQTPYDMPPEHTDVPEFIEDETPAENTQSDTSADDGLADAELGDFEFEVAESDGAGSVVEAPDELVGESLAGDTSDVEGAEFAHSLENAGAEISATAAADVAVDEEPNPPGNVAESTGEFEAQIEAAASAFASIDADAITNASADQADSPEAPEEAPPDEVEAVSTGLAEDAEPPQDELDAGLATDLDQIADAIDEIDALDSTDTTDTADEDDQPKLEEEQFELPEQSAAEMTINQEIDQELMALAVQDDEFSATLVGSTSADLQFDEDSKSVEAIVMEGDTVHNAVDQERRAAEIAARNQMDDPESLGGFLSVEPEKIPGGRQKFVPPKRSNVAAAAGLCVILAIQLVHNSREALATGAFFDKMIAPVYRVFGNPVTPQWNIKGWQFETTKGSVEGQEAALVVVSRLVNRTAETLPYPLVHVSLTDRWENIIGSRILSPGEYLAGALDSNNPVQPGENFTAVITIDNPSAEATGFKLNVCYRDGPETVRCAIEDFKN